VKTNVGLAGCIVAGNHPETRMDLLADSAGDDTHAAGMRRVALNQATLRRINEGIDGTRESGLIAFRCECGQLGCNRLVPLRRPQYEAVRARARRFLVAPGHIVGELEHVVEQHPRHAVVETHPHTSGVADQTDPRAVRPD
jgi:hypothetical protein